MGDLLGRQTGKNQYSRALLSSNASNPCGRKLTCQDALVSLLFTWACRYTTAAADPPFGRRPRVEGDGWHAAADGSSPSRRCRLRRRTRAPKTSTLPEVQHAGRLSRRDKVTWRWSLSCKCVTIRQSRAEHLGRSRRPRGSCSYSWRTRGSSVVSGPGHGRVSAPLLSAWVDAVTGKDTRCPYSVTSSHWLWLAPAQAFKPYSTANKSLSSDTIHEKVCSRSSAQPLSVFGLHLFWSLCVYSPFWHFIDSCLLSPLQCLPTITHIAASRCSTWPLVT